VTVVVDADFRAGLRETAREFLANYFHSAALRSRLAGDGEDAAVDAAIFDLGWPGVEVPEEHGGLGAGFGDLAILLHEMGRRLYSAAWVGSAVVGVPALRRADAELRDAWLPGIATGERNVAGALWGEHGVPGAIDVRAEPSGDGWELSGVAAFVPHLAELAETDAVVIAARNGAGDGTELFLVGAAAPGVRRESVPTFDRTRHLGRLELSRVRVGERERIGRSGDGPELLAELLDRTAAALACDAVGGCEQLLEMTVQHLKDRQQFGRPIGSFQALKHRAADMFLRLEASRSAAATAADAIDGTDRRALAASVAKSYAGDAYVEVAAEAVQLHGGIGYTWEADLHLYLKRARLGQVLGGTSEWHRSRLAATALEAV
jgi:alkylation response protein AidB-like acyl-CoA dehydrogenase